MTTPRIITAPRPVRCSRLEALGQHHWYLCHSRGFSRWWFEFYGTKVTDVYPAAILAIEAAEAALAAVTGGQDEG
jgi:hypothetical protein